MAKLLPAIGRSDALPRAVDRISSTISDIQNREIGKQKIRANEFELKKAQDAEDAFNKPLSGSLLRDRFTVPEVADYAEALADSRGYLDRESVPNDTVIKAGHSQEVFKMLSEPEHIAKISSMRMNHWQNQISEAKSVLAEKPNDKNAQQALQRASIEYQSAIAQNKNLVDFMKANKERGATPATDIDDFVADAEIVFKNANPNATEADLAKMRNKSRLQIKRAQSDEQSRNRFAVRNADAETAERIKFNEGVGKNLAIIATAADVIEAKGEISPQDKITTAKARMGGNLSKLAEHYINLDSTGAIVNVENNTFENIQAAMRASTVGQAFGRMAGTDEQSIRKSINNIKPLLIQDIRQSTDMGARGLDSERELDFYLQAATDEKSDIQSNIAAIVVLDEAFGNGEVAQQLRGLTDESLISRISNEGQVILQGSGKDSGVDDRRKRLEELRRKKAGK